VEELARSFLRDPVRILVGARNAAVDTVHQRLLFVGREEGKLIALRNLVREGIAPPVLVFVQSKDRADQLYKELVAENIQLEVMSPYRSTHERDELIARFRRGDIWLLISTDVLARGMDFKGVKCVINYDFPLSISSYIHRIGRTGRAGRSGEAITFFTESDMQMLGTIAHVVKNSGGQVEEWMLRAPKISKKKKKQYQSNQPPTRKAISSVPPQELKAEREAKNKLIRRKKAKLARRVQQTTQDTL